MNPQNRLIVVENGTENVVENIAGLTVNWLGQNGTLRVFAPFTFVSSIIQVGTDCTIEIGGDSRICDLFLRCAADKSKVVIGKNFSIESGQFIMPRDHARHSLCIGNDCLFSSSIFIQTADGHTVLDLNGNILNEHDGHIQIADHVWLGHGVSVLKKASIATNTIVAESAVVTKKFVKPNCILAGVPAKIIKTNVSWDILSPQLYKEKTKTSNSTKSIV